jgi:hypothetical protein
LPADCQDGCRKSSKNTTRIKRKNHKKERRLA